MRRKRICEYSMGEKKDVYTLRCRYFCDFSSIYYRNSYSNDSRAYQTVPAISSFIGECSGESFTIGIPIVKKRRRLSSKDVHNFFLTHRILANPFPTHQVMPGANVFHGLAIKLRDRFLTFSWHQNQRGPLGLSCPYHQVLPPWAGLV